MSPRFSIVLPTHNRADVLPFAIRSALWQTQPDFELLIGGDGCSDGTADVVATFGDSRIRWFDLPKAPGIGYANRNRVLREARGRWIAYLAHDDLWFPDHLERLESLLVDTNAAFAYSRGLAVGTDGLILPYWYNLEVPAHRTGLASGQAAITMCTVVHERASLDRHGYWDETLAYSGDKELWHRMVGDASADRLAFLSEPTTLHFVANWRNTPLRRLGARVLGGVAGGLLDDVPAALRLPADSTRSQQEAAWDWLRHDPQARVRDIRRGVVAFQDAVLWNAERMPGLVGLAGGRAIARGLARLWRGVRFVASPGYRTKLTHLKARTTPGKKGT